MDISFKAQWLFKPSFYCIWIQAFEELEIYLNKKNICIAVKERLAKDSGVAEEAAYNDIVKKLLSKPRATGNAIIKSYYKLRKI